MQTNEKKCASQTDLTQGKIVKTLLWFSIPILLSYLLQNVYTIADAAICGYTLNGNQVAGVNDTSALSFLFLQFAIGCTSGMSVLTADCAGKKDDDGMRKAFAAQIVLGVAVAAVLTAAGLLSVKPLLRLLGVTNGGNETSREVYRAAFAYISVICGGIAAQFFYNMICCVLRSVGDSLTPLLFLLASTVLNVALDLIFIKVCRWGVIGAATATVLSQAIAAVGCFVCTFLRYPALRLHAADFKGITGKLCGRTLWQGVPLGLQFSVLALGIAVMSNGVIAFDKTADGGMVTGTPAQIGYSAACKLNNIFTTPLSALGTAMLSFCGQNHGAEQHERIRKGVLHSVWLSAVVFAVVWGAELLLSLGGVYQHLFLASDKITPQTVRFGNLYLYTVLPCNFFLAGILVLRNVTQGVGKPLYPFLAGVAELIGRVVVCLLLPAYINGGAISAAASNAAYVGLCLADPAAWLAGDIPLLIATCLFVFGKRPKKEREQRETEKTKKTEKTEKT